MIFKRFQIFIFFLLALIAQNAFAVYEHSDAKIYSENVPYQWVTQKNQFYQQIDLKFSPLLYKRYGLSYRISYSMGPSAIDLQGSYFVTNWRAISAPITQAELNAASFYEPGGVSDQQGSQINVLRQRDDPWTQWILEFGYSYRGRLVPLNERFWMQSARFSVGYTGLTDKNADLSFKGFTFNTEFMMMYQVNPNFLLGPTIGYRWGWAYLSGREQTLFNRIPLLSLDSSIGAIFKL